MTNPTLEQKHRAAREKHSNAFNTLLSCVSKLGGNAHNLLHSEHRAEQLKRVQAAITELKNTGNAFDELMKPNGKSKPSQPQGERE
ncbi:hypothetical protein [Pseudoalteromonas luteoviolacea]|uniref:hypothetical protein n=1 Tax=Pseudoalteromonas luteoviolacea TaxID=43657 RepID=UPI00114F5CBB|nr:hypothetical protein [Pseudoalteromonas luteoviolacea]TQF71792.1 hypothetical protein FLM44_12215 [Pseudoalteromonas luteoviolacea]